MSMGSCNEWRKRDGARGVMWGRNLGQDTGFLDLMSILFGRCVMGEAIAAEVEVSGVGLRIGFYHDGGVDRSIVDIRGAGWRVCRGR